MESPAKSKASLDNILPEMYDELHRLAAAYMRRERADHTLQPTALVNEAYLRLMTQHNVDFTNRAHLLGVAAQMMRRILRTHEEGRSANKRGGQATVVCLDDAQPSAVSNTLQFLELDDALHKLEALDERQARVAELRLFGGLNLDEVAEYLHVSTATAQRDWISGRLWLMHTLRPRPA